MLKGKAQKTNAVLSVEDCAYYIILKSAIFKMYELLPLVYRHRFKDLWKIDKLTSCFREKTKLILTGGTNREIFKFTMIV